MGLKEKGREAVGSTVTPTQAAVRGGESVREGVWMKREERRGEMDWKREREREREEREEDWRNI